MGKRKVPAHEARSANHEVQSANVLLGHRSLEWQMETAVIRDGWATVRGTRMYNGGSSGK